MLELNSILTICRNGLHQGIMSFMLDKSETTMQRIFNIWIIFLSTLLNKIGGVTRGGVFIKKDAKKSPVKL